MHTTTDPRRTLPAAAPSQTSPRWPTDAEPQVRRALAELQLSTIPRGEGDEDKVARLELYLRDLRQYPPGKVLTVLRGWTKQGPDAEGRRPGRFFPSWDELEAKLAPQTRPAEHRLALPRRDITPDPEIGRKMRRLNEALSKGEDVAALKAKGEI